jgi:hypothetical protein
MEQRRILYRGREFHFASYEGQPANEKQSRPATEPAWWLIGGGSRFEALPYHKEQPPDELERQLTDWIDRNVYGPPAPGV